MYILLLFIYIIYIISILKLNTKTVIRYNKDLLLY